MDTGPGRLLPLLDVLIVTAGCGTRLPERAFSDSQPRATSSIPQSSSATTTDGVTRSYVEAYLSRRQPYDGHGLLLPRTFTVGTDDLAPHRGCLEVARWQDSANDGRGGWVSQPPGMTHNCYLVPSIAYRP